MGFPGITNHVVKIPGSTVTAYLGVADGRPDEWIYTLWTQDAEDEELISHGDLNFSPMRVTPNQVARVAFLLDVEYAPTCNEVYGCDCNDCEPLDDCAWTEEACHASQARHGRGDDCLEHPHNVV